jgi:hypothetical protein
MRSCFLLALFVLSAGLRAEDTGAWEAVRSLVGEWKGEGTGGPGEGKGGFSFAVDLDGHIITRRNYAEYPATKDRPAFRHQDVMIVFREADQIRAVYWDSEGHVIRYEVRAAASGKAITFMSDAASPGPRYRLTNELETPERMKIKFEIAPPGKPEQFSTYIEAGARKVSK